MEGAGEGGGEAESRTEVHSSGEGGEGSAKGGHGGWAYGTVFVCK